MSVRSDRLQSEYREISKFRSNVVLWEAIQGSPPEKYRFTYNLKSMVGLTNNMLQIHTGFIVDVTYPLDYPLTVPDVRLVSFPRPFHPNIYEDGRFYLFGGAQLWIPGIGVSLYSISQLVGEIIAFQTYDLGSPTNYDGHLRNWLLNNEKSLPIDTTPIRLLDEEFGEESEIRRMEHIGNSICPICKLEIDESSDVTRCVSCQTLFHKECVKQLSDNAKEAKYPVGLQATIEIESKGKSLLKNLTIVIEHTGKRIPIIEVDSQITALELLTALANKINLPENTRGILTRMSTHKQVLPEQSLQNARIEDNETLVADFERTAGCFLAGTKITTLAGEKLPIEQVKIGDEVLSYSLKTKTTFTSKVADIYHGIEHSYLIINNNLTVTPTHFVHINGNWQRAGTIQIGDFLQSEYGEAIEVTSIEVENAELDVYNLNLSTGSIFFADGVLVSKYDKDIDANFFADGFLVQTYAAKAIVANPFPTEKIQPENSFLRKWWHTVLRNYGRYSCYAIFLSLPSDKEAIRYLLEFGDELDLISAADCLFIALSTTDFQVSNVSIDNETWVSVINQQMTEGHSIRVADFFNIDYVSFPCMVLFNDIRSSEHVVITLKDMSAEDIAQKMRSIFSLIHKAIQQKENPLIVLERERNKQYFLSKGESIVSGFRSFVGKSFEAGMESWIKKIVFGG